MSTPYLPMLSPVFMREEEDLGRLSTKRPSKSPLGRLFIEIRHFSDEKLKAMLLAAEVMLLHAEVMLLYALKECMEIKKHLRFIASA